MRPLIVRQSCRIWEKLFYKSDGEERIKDIAADLRRQNAAYTRQLKKSLSDQSKEILENSMADGRTILQEYDEKNEKSHSRV